jgi:ABC-type phosphate transport system substrate-binding protein
MMNSPIRCGLRKRLYLYESSLDVAERTKDDWDIEYLASVDTHKQEILSSKTSVTYTGTAYYVSNNGSNSNNGLTESNAWATLEKVSNAKLKPGDAVFFERGGLYRGYLARKHSNIDTMFECFFYVRKALFRGFFAFWGPCCAAFP